MPRALLLLLSVAAGLAISATTAHAAVGSRVTIRFEPPNVIGGKVKSPRKACETNRKVLLLYNDGSGFRVVASSATTNRKGAWGYQSANPPAGTYKGKAKAKRAGGRTCAVATSRTVSVP